MVQVQLQFNDEDTWVDAHDYIKENKAADAKVFSWTLWKYEMGPEMVAADGTVKVKVRAIANDGEV